MGSGLAWLAPLLLTILQASTDVLSRRPGRVGVLMNPRHLYISRHGSGSVAVWESIEDDCNYGKLPCALHGLLRGQGAPRAVRAR